MLIGACNPMLRQFHAFRAAVGPATAGPAAIGATTVGCGNFDIVLGPASRISQLYATPRVPPPACRLICSN